MKIVFLSISVALSVNLYSADQEENSLITLEAEGLVAAIAFSHHSRLVATAMKDGKKVSFFDTSDYQKKADWDVGFEPTALAFVAHNKLIAGCSNGSILEFDLEKFKTGRSFAKYIDPEYATPVHTVAYADQGIPFVSSYNKEVVLWDFAQKNPVYEVTAKLKNMTGRDVAFLSDNKRVLIGSDAGVKNFKYLDIGSQQLDRMWKDDELLPKWAEQEYGLIALATSRVNNSFAVSINNHKVVLDSDINDHFVEIPNKSYLNESSKFVALSPDNKMLITEDPSRNRVYIWDSESGIERAGIFVGNDVTGITFSATSTQCAISTQNGAYLISLERFLKKFEKKSELPSGLSAYYTK